VVKKLQAKMPDILTIFFEKVLQQAPIKTPDEKKVKRTKKL